MPDFWDGYGSSTERDLLRKENERLREENEKLRRSWGMVTEPEGWRDMNPYWPFVAPSMPRAGTANENPVRWHTTSP